MTNEQFIAALTKALGGLDKASRNDIIQEIQSHEAAEYPTEAFKPEEGYSEHNNALYTSFEKFLLQTGMPKEEVYITFKSVYAEVEAGEQKKRF